MSKTLLGLIGGISIVGGLIGYTLLGSHSAAHEAGDGHEAAEHSAVTGHLPGDGHADIEHGTQPAAHDDVGSGYHVD